MEVKRAMVVGAGIMGCGISQVLAQDGMEVFLKDSSIELAEEGKNKLKKNLTRLAEKGKISTDYCEKIIGRISPTADYSCAGNVELIVEAVFENIDVKKEVFGELDRFCGENTILASNTSSLSITEIASATSRADKVIGMHFFNPAPVMKLIEVVRGLRTSDETFQIIYDLSLKLDKSPVEAKDSPGFVASRIPMVMVNEAIFAHWEGVGTVESIDAAIKLGFNHPIGPLQLADLIGLDVCLNIMNTLYEGFNDPKYRPCPLLKKMVAAGWLGKKTGKGFYEYAK